MASDRFDRQENPAMASTRVVAARQKASGADPGIALAQQGSGDLADRPFTDRVGEEYERWDGMS